MESSGRLNIEPGTVPEWVLICTVSTCGIFINVKLGVYLDYLQWN